MSEIIRRQKGRENPFAQIPRLLLQNEELTFASRGLMAYVLSRPDDWTVMVADLIQQSPSGRDAVRSILRELQDFGYIHRERVRIEGGQFTWISTVYDDPRDNANFDPGKRKNHAPKSESANSSSSTYGNPANGEMADGADPPSTGFPSVVEPSTVNPSITVERTTEIENHRDIYSPLRGEEPAEVELVSQQKATAQSVAQKAAESVTPDIRIQSQVPAKKTMAEVAAELRSRSASRQQPPSVTQGKSETGIPETVKTEADQASDSQLQSESPSAPNTPVARPPSSPKPKKTPKETAPRKRDGFADSIAVACYGTVESHTQSTWKQITKVKGELIEAGISVDDVTEIVEWMKRDPYWQKRGIEPASIPYQVSKWRASPRKTGVPKVGDDLQSKYGQEELF